MIRDLYFRFKGLAAMRAFLRRAAIQDMIGDMFYQGDGDRTHDLRRNFAYVIIRPGTVTVTPATYDNDGNELTPTVVDPRPWLLLRLLDLIYLRDDRTGTDWTTRSHLVRHIWLTGVRDTKRGVPMARLDFGNNHWVEVYSTRGLVRRGIVPWVIAGGPHP